MKKKLLSVFSILTLLSTIQAQVLFNEDFDGISGPTAGGAGTYSFPNGWLLRNSDNRTPDAAVAYVNEAWERREDFANNVTDSAAFSTSWYSPVGAADDWMWTPLIGPITANTVLSWNALAYDPSYPDGYEVRVMTQSSTPGGPTGGNGLLGNQVTSSTQVFSVVAENTAWTVRNVSLAAFAGETVWVGFRNTSNNQFLLLIDDIKVENILNYDAEVLSAVSPIEYTEVPLNQQPSFFLSASVRNNGSQPVTNVVLTANVYDQSNNLVHTSTAPALANLAAGATGTSTVSVAFTPTVTGTFRFQYSVAINEADGVPSNNVIVNADSIVITDTVYARDKNALVGSVGIGAGLTGYLGNMYVVSQTAKLSSVSVFLNGQQANSTIGVQVNNFTNNAPGAVVLYSDTVVLSAAQTGWYTFVMNSGGLTLAADTYLVSIVEYDTTLKIGQATDKFRNGRFWVNWATSPFGGWAPIENFGGSFTKALMIRANLNDLCASAAGTVSAISSADTICVGETVTLNGSGAVSYSWSGGVSNGVAFPPSASATYIVTGTDVNGCTDTASVSVVVDLCLDIKSIASGSLHVYPNPSKGLFYVETKEQLTFNVYNSLGEMISSTKSNSGRVTIDLSAFENGIYLLKVINDNGDQKTKVLVKE